MALTAFSRVWRRGQTKETELFRPVVHDSIDEKILNMQEEKSANIAKVYRPDKEDKYVQHTPLGQYNETDLQQTHADGASITLREMMQSG